MPYSLVMILHILSLRFWLVTLIS